MTEKKGRKRREQAMENGMEKKEEKGMGSKKGIGEGHRRWQKMKTIKGKGGSDKKKRREEETRKGEK